MDTYKLFAQEIVVVTLRDYARGEPPVREQIRNWLALRPITFRYCAQALVEGDMNRLTEIILKKMQEIDRGETSPGEQIKRSVRMV